MLGTYLVSSLLVFTSAVMYLSHSSDVLRSACIFKPIFACNFFKVKSEMGQ